MESDELKHYGVVGMKWGVRRGHADVAYSKASNKLNKIQNKNLKIQSKMEKKIRQASASKHPNSKKALRRKAEIHRLANKSLGRMRKAEKWVNKMEKVFADTPYKLTKEQRDIGAQYVKTLKARQNSIFISDMYR